MAETTDTSDESTIAPSPPVTKEQPIFSLRIFQTLDAAQSGHGIPHKDFPQYAAYLTKRLARVRHVKAVRATLVHNHKYVEGVSGRRHAYAARTKNPVFVEHENPIWSLFYQAERAWAVACELQQNQSASKVNLHPHVQRRLNKAVKFAVLLEDLSRRCCDEQTVAECQAYAAWMKANAALEHKTYVAAYQDYKSSMNLLLQLAATVDTDTSPDALALRDIWTTRAETVLRPLVRFCQYEAKDIVEAEESTTKTSVQPTTSGGIVLSFRGKDIALDSYKQLKVLYLKMESILAADTSHLDEGQFLQLLSDLDDALDLVQVEHSHYATLSAGPAVTAKREELMDLKGYFQYQKLAVSRQQQEARIQDLTQDAEIVHVYDALQQNTVAMAALSSASGGADNNVEDDPFYLEAQAHVVRIRAFRCYYLARLYESTLSGTPQQVLALLRQAKQLTAQAREEIAACDMDDADTYLTALKDLASKIQALMTRAEALRYLQTKAATGGSSKSDRPLWLRLDDLDAGSVLADDPPLTIPMPCKPAFYDVAWQYVGGDFPLDELDAYIATHEPKSTSSGGLLSWFSSSKS
jgi:signal recognition particle subunit SRP68